MCQIRVGEYKQSLGIITSVIKPFILYSSDEMSLSVQ